MPKFGGQTINDWESETKFVHFVFKQAKHVVTNKIKWLDELCTSNELINKI